MVGGKPLDKWVSGGLIVGMETVAALRETMVEIGRRLYDKSLVAGTDGNMSCRLPDGLFLITPSGKAKGRLLAGDMIIIDELGAVIAGEGKPSSEFRLHTFIYSARGDINAILHAHPVFCTAFASAGRPLADSILPEIILSVGEVPLAEYGTPSTQELPRSIENLVGDHDAILLGNHGLVVGGKDLEDSYNRLEMIEHYAMIVHAAQAIGGARSLSDDQIMRLARVRDTFDQRTRDHD